MFHERDVLVYEEMARDRRRRREEDRLLAAVHRKEPGKQTRNRRRKSVMGLRLLIGRLLPAR